jgi:hypothetical protein
VEADIRYATPQPQRNLSLTPFHDTSTNNICNMYDTQYILWCYIERDDTYFHVIASPTIFIAELKDLIKVEKSNLLQKVDAPTSY